MSRNPIITGLDIETTGLDFASGDRIIEICLLPYRLADTSKPAIDFTRRINPEGKSIHAKAHKVHGISAVDLVKEKPFSHHAPAINAILKKSDAIVTHNGESFDIPFLAFEMAKAGFELPAKVISFDTMREGMFASYDAKPPSLKELCYTMGVTYEDAKAHAADYDVRVMMDCFFKAVDRELFDISAIKGDGA